MHARLELSIFRNNRECQRDSFLRLMYVQVTAISTEFDPNVQSAQDEIHVWKEPLFL